MDTILDGIKHVLTLLGKTILFMLLSIIFLPSFLVVTYLQETWSSMMSELFNF
jgi:hypothetical protein